MNDLIPKHGGYRKLKSFRISQLVYDITVRFCDQYIDRRSRTHDQMVQAARSGVQNIAEGSKASGTSKKMELKLTNVARASLEELRLDYEDFLRHRGFELLPPDHPVLMRFKQKRCASLQCVKDWVAEERARRLKIYQESLTQTNTDHQGQTQTTDNEHHRQNTRPCRSVSVRVSPCQSVFSQATAQAPPPQSKPPLRSSELAANAALSLLNLACYLLDRQIAAQAGSFEKEGGFTERLYKRRVQARRNSGYRP